MKRWAGMTGITGGFALPSRGRNRTARAYFLQCGNGIVQPENPDEATAEILYQIFNRRSCQTEPFQTRVDRVVLDTMAAQGLTLGLDPVPEIPVVDFLAPRGIDFTQSRYTIMDGRYYTVLMIREERLSQPGPGGLDIHPHQRRGRH